MFSEVFKEVTGILDRRFLLNSLFPCLIWWGLIGIVVIVGLGLDLTKVVQAWNQQEAILKVLQIVGFIGVVVFSANILLSQSTAILRFYEGYWDFPLIQCLVNKGKNWHQGRLKTFDAARRVADLAQQMKAVQIAIQRVNQQDQLQSQREELEQQSRLRQQQNAMTQGVQEVQAQLQRVNQQLQQLPSEQKALPFIGASLNRAIQKLYQKIQRIKLGRQQARLQREYIRLQQIEASLNEAIYLYYPKPAYSDQVMPTRLGNILKNSELYPLDRYGIDPVLVWPRLYHLLPERFIQVVVEARSSLDFMLAISTLSILFALASGVILLSVKAAGWLFLVCFWGGSLAALLAYKGALGNALMYAEQQKVAFDLYRNELLKQMRLKLPATPQKENEQWHEIRELIYGEQVPASLTYSDPQPEEQ